MIQEDQAIDATRIGHRAANYDAIGIARKLTGQLKRTGMAIYMTLKNIPELARLSPEERLRVWRQGRRRARRHWQTWIGWTACGVCGGLGTHLGGLHGSPVLGAAIGGGLGGFIGVQVTICVARANKYFT